MGVFRQNSRIGCRAGKAGELRKPARSKGVTTHLLRAGFRNYSMKIFHHHQFIIGVLQMRVHQAATIF